MDPLKRVEDVIAMEGDMTRRIRRDEGGEPTHKGTGRQGQVTVVRVASSARRVDGDGAGRLNGEEVHVLRGK